MVRLLLVNGWLVSLEGCDRASWGGFWDVALVMDDERAQRGLRGNVTQQGALATDGRLPPLPPARRKTILVVEDNELNMKLFRDLLEARGHTVVQTRNGMDALQLAREHKPDLIIMDIQLPEVSGLEVTKWIKEDDALRAIPIIAVTAFAMKGDEEKIRESGCEDYIAKPMSVMNFLNTVERFLRRGLPN
jgi:two-component system cell cycle response regulator DivK